jgi:hypothetical protein
VLVVDDLVAWLIGRLADAGYQKLTALVLGSPSSSAADRSGNFFPGPAPAASRAGGASRRRGSRPRQHSGCRASPGAGRDGKPEEQLGALR